MVKNKNETSLALRNNMNKAGYDLGRLRNPERAHFNDDYLCGICQSKFLT
jgi:hypothetical protein